MTRRVAIIPARGGSKGIPRKNLARVGGRSLVGRSVLHARQCRSIDDVVVSTDDEEIAAEARRHGAIVILRPDHLSGDDASTESAIADALLQLAAHGRRYDDIALLQCTSPFRSPGQLDAAFALLDDAGVDCVFSATAFHGFVWLQDTMGAATPATYAPGQRPRRQDNRGVVLETGSFYLFSAAGFARTGCRMHGVTVPCLVPSEDAIEIDTPQELEQARLQAHLRGDTDLCDAAAQGRWLVLDVDGTQTDGAMYVDAAGEETKRFHTRDGRALALWKQAGGRVMWITGERSGAVRARADKLGVDVLVEGCQDKRSALVDHARRYRLSSAELIAVGDDDNDLAMRDLVDTFVAPADAHAKVRAVADLTLSARGGHGAIRELVDHLLAARARLGEQTDAGDVVEAASDLSIASNDAGAPRQDAA